MGFAAYAPIAALFVIGALAGEFPLTDEPLYVAVLRTLSALLGLTATLSWWAMVSRSRTMQTYWVNSGRILEEQLAGVSTMQRGKELTERGFVDIPGARGSTHVRFSVLGKVSHRISFRIIFGMCTCIFSVLLFWNIVKFIHVA